MGQSRNVLLVAGAIAFLLFFVGSVSASPATRIPAAARAHEITKLAAWSSRGPVLALMYTGPLGGTLDASLRRAKVPAPLVRQACAAAKQDSALSSLGRLSAGSYELLAVRRGRQLQLVETHVWEADRDYRLYRYVGAVSPEWVDGQGRFVTHANLVRPVEGGRMSSGFGWRVHPVLGDWRFHNGVDFALPKGSPVFAAESGVVEEIGYHGNYGRLVRISDGHGIESGLSRAVLKFARQASRSEQATRPWRAVQDRG